MTKQELIDHLQHLEQYTHYSEDAPALREVIKMLECSEMPNGSEEHTDKRTGTHACDCISRQAAIDAVKEAIISDEWEYAEKALERLPSVQPEPLTDKEKRIFLAAMGREEKVCKQVDDEFRNCREPYEDSLVRTCHEITRKVKGALWELPSAQPEQQWIPCSERLPEDDTEVFVYLFDRQSPYIAWVCDGCWFTEEFQVEKENYPKAWCELPEPYKERREE